MTAARAQFKQQRAHLGQRPARQLPQLLGALPSLLRVDGVEIGQHLGDQAGGEQGLRDRVVQVARQARALGDHGVTGSLLGSLVRQRLLGLAALFHLAAQVGCLLGDGLFEPAILDAHVVHAPAVAGKGQAGDQQQGAHLEPPRLPHGRRDAQRQRQPGLVPDAVVVAAAHPEGVAAGRQVSVGGVAPVARLDPILVKAIQLVGVAILLRCAKIERRKVE